MSRILLSAVALASLSLTACDSADPVDPTPTPLNVQRAESIPANPGIRDSTTGITASVNRYTLYSLREGRIVLPSSEADPAIRQRDSASTAWDIGFRVSTVIFNGGTSGPGQGAAQILTGRTFAEVLEAPESGYVADGGNTSCPAVQTPGGPQPGSTLAICTGSDNGWYNYTSSTNLFTPLPGRTVVLKTAIGTYAKLRFLSYYQGAPEPPDANAPSRYYTFEYVVQPDGSRNFETTTLGE